MTDNVKGSPQEQAQILVQALPHMLRYDEASIVVKYGGHAMGDESVARDFAGAGLLVLTSPDRLHADWLSAQRNRGRTAGLVDRSARTVHGLPATGTVRRHSPSAATRGASW